MKILHCITCIDDAGGAEKLMEDLLPGLKHAGCDVSCLVFNGFDSNNRQIIENAGVHVYELSHNNHYYSPLKLFKLIPYVRKFDIIHAHNTPPVLFVAISSIFGKAKLVMTEHNTNGRLRGKIILSNFYKNILNRYDAIICCSNAVENSLREEYTLRYHKVLTINNGVRLSRFINAEPLSEIINLKCKIITMVAWFRYQKNHITVINALKILPEEFHIIFVGAGPTLEDCKDYARKIGLEHRIHFLGLRTDIPAILKSSDYVVLSSHYEGLSLSSIEGMCVGKPFIASDVDGLREIVRDAGVLFPDGDAKKLADIILELDRNPDLYCEIADKCYQRAMQYDISSMIEGYKKIYDQIEKEL